MLNWNRELDTINMNAPYEYQPKSTAEECLIILNYFEQHFDLLVSQAK